MQIVISCSAVESPGPDRSNRSRRFRLRAVAAPAALAAAALGWCGCGFFAAKPPVEGVGEVLGNMMSAMASAPPPDSRVALLGFRDADGKRTLRTETLDEALVSAALSRDLPVAPGVGLLEELRGEPALRWSMGSLLPRGWEELEAPRLLGGQVRYEPPWAYLRLVLVDRADGTVLRSVRGRVPEGELDRRGRALAALRGSDGEAEISDFDADVDLHLLVRRVEGEFPQLVELSEGEVLRGGDQLQVRFRVGRTCAVWAFLQLSSGERLGIFSGDRVYGARLEYGPGENEWIDLDRGNEVYTLYFVVAEDLEGERREDLFEEIAELVDNGQLNRFEGIDRVDALLADFLSNQLEGSPAVEVLRSGEIESGDSEVFTYENGETFESVPEVLYAAPVLVRAVSFEVQPN